MVAAYRRHFVVALADGERVACVLKGRSLQVAVGDRVEIRRVAGGGAIESVAARSNLVYRSDAFKDKLLAANVTQIAGVVAPDISLDEELIDRWMIAAESTDCRFVLFANKSDLPGFEVLRKRLAPFAALGCGIVELAAIADPAPALDWLADQRTVLVGQSGMGKSTLINALLPEAGVRTADVSDSLGAGRHTTTSTTLYPLPALGRDTWIVDSPGMKIFGLAQLEPARIAEAFVEIRPHLGHCRFRDCRHDAEPGCAVTEAVVAGRIAPHRLRLLHTLQAEANFARGKAR
ncbi:MAG: ribosome small subunit-dependent GTPase A [Burkholderiales bacterium]|nr:ribosome small subunit-dependent GTPase A [Burkholderiales bacterium]